MTTKCYSVRLAEFYPISNKCYKAVAFDGSEALIPASQYFGIDSDVSKSDAAWISEWILERKNLQYSKKKSAYMVHSEYDNDVAIYAPKKIVKTHNPSKKNPIEPRTIKSLER
ncbi:MAG: hypothetical protein ACK5MK_07010 [Dysgonomonas sp.]